MKIAKEVENIRRRSLETRKKQMEEAMRKDNAAAEEERKLQLEKTLQNELISAKNEVKQKELEDDIRDLQKHENFAVKRAQVVGDPNQALAYISSTMPYSVSGVQKLAKKMKISVNDRRLTAIRLAVVFLKELSPRVTKKADETRIVYMEGHLNKMKDMKEISLSDDADRPKDDTSYDTHGV